MKKRYAVVVAALAAATLAGGTNAAAATPDQPSNPTGSYTAHASGHKTLRASKSATGARVAAEPDPGAQFTALPAPVRVLDTRNGTGIPGRTTPVGPAETITIDLAGTVPLEAEAVVMNLAGTESTGNTFVTVYPTAISRPTVGSNLNLAPGQTRSNSVTSALLVDNRLNLYNNAGSEHLILDVSGYYVANVGSKFTPTDPTRVLDTRFSSPVGPRSVLNLDFSTAVPANATAVTFNLAGTEGNANTFITAFPAGGSVPTAANMNLVPGETSSNLVTVGLSADKKVGLFNNNGSTHLVVDLAGYFTPDQGFVFFSFLPSRLFDTRVDGHGPVRPDFPLHLLFTDFPPNPQSLVASLAGTEATSGMFVVAYPFGSARPNAANLNLLAGQTAANMTTTKAGPPPAGSPPEVQFAITYQNNVGSVQVILDLAGVYGPPVPA